MIDTGVETSRECEAIANALPPLPWNILWIEGFCYLIDHNQKKIATLYGRQIQREAVAEVMLMAFGEKTAP